VTLKLAQSHGGGGGGCPEGVGEWIRHGGGVVCPTNHPSLNF